ncbi:Gfo/Idh/MocA family oxidoreductase [Aquihabitans sp. G128]|uniref:Gfo/Idh/MocA family protein n=1 Tax=Aquihabitans sp. G128 TaxID=2849779 RepID=UPI001C247E4A|nr:Gfo/Idh/MocA family oxidoreductase [Aquihabitans sp. G128]QXC61708.1 Gfo/Idh/MocA family oxidoreductase [Aquihabitans sp. G128]
MSMTSGPPTPQDGEVGVAVIGAGYWGPNLVRNFLNCDRTWLWAVCDLDEQRARTVVGKRSSIEVTSRFEDLLADDRIEAVAIATPAATHLPLALAAIEAGKHILVEKPLALSAADARTIAEAAERAGLVAMCDHTFCYTPAVNRIRDEIAAGHLGRIQYVDSVRINLGLVQRDTDVFWDLLPHDLSILDSVLPAGTGPVAVSALGVDPIGAGKPCVGYVSLLLPDDAIAHVHVSWLSPVKIRNVVIGGSLRHLVWNDTDPTQRISTYERGVDIAEIEDEDEQRQLMFQYRTGDMHAPALTDAEALQSLVRDFATCIREGGTPRTDSWQGVRVLEVLEAVDRSRAADGVLVPVR